MRLAIFLVLALSVAIISSCTYESAATNPQESNDPPANSAPAAKHPVLVELFTSEGCSSCPPADRALSLLEKQQPVNSADVITLEFHVDYWDGPGWKDPFSSRLFTQRQEEYGAAFKLDSNYTPQMVVDGESEFVGSDLGKAANIIEKFAATPKGNIDTHSDADLLKIAISNLPAHKAATVFLAAAEDNLTSNVTGGENGGSKLAHTSVVRELKSIGMVGADTDKFEIEAALSLQPAWKKDGLRYVVFVQENSSRKVLAVGRVSK